MGVGTVFPERVVISSGRSAIGNLPSTMWSLTISGRPSRSYRDSLVTPISLANLPIASSSGQKTVYSFSSFFSKSSAPVRLMEVPKSTQSPFFAIWP